MKDKGMIRFVRRRRRMWLMLGLSLWLAVLAIPSANVAAGRGGGLAQPNPVLDGPQVP
jgi:hypothetical protein